MILCGIKPVRVEVINNCKQCKNVLKLLKSTLNQKFVSLLKADDM